MAKNTQTAKNVPVILTIAALGLKVPSAKPEAWSHETWHAVKTAAAELLERQIALHEGVTALHVVTGVNAGFDLCVAAAALALKKRGLPVTLTVHVPFRTKDQMSRGRRETKPWDGNWSDKPRSWFASVLKAADSVRYAVEHAADSDAGEVACVVAADDVVATADVLLTFWDRRTKGIVSNAIACAAVDGRRVTNTWEQLAPLFPGWDEKPAAAKAAAPAVPAGVEF